MTDDVNEDEVPMNETSTAEERSITANRVIEAPPERVYEAFFNHDDLAAWVAPDGFSAEVQELDPEEGGSFRIAMDAETEELEQYSHTFRGTYRELKRGEKVVWTDESGEGDDHGTATVSLDAVPEGTEVTIRIGGIPEHVPVEEEQIAERWGASLEKLAGLLEG